MDYTIQEHQHRFAAWAAGRAASVKNYRFSVAAATEMLKEAGFTEEFLVEHLPARAEIDEVHRGWRNAVIKAGGQRKLPLTHGVAAKLINVYLKARFVCGGHALHERVRCLHPPIDRVLLEELAKKDVGGSGQKWLKFAGWRWSKFSSEQYQEVINTVRGRCEGRPLWEIEEYWVGHQ
jgi:hypothetical protein